MLRAARRSPHTCGPVHVRRQHGEHLAADRFVQHPIDKDVPLQRLLDERQAQQVCARVRSSPMGLHYAMHGYNASKVLRRVAKQMFRHRTIRSPASTSQTHGDTSMKYAILVVTHPVGTDLSSSSARTTLCRFCPCLRFAETPAVFGDHPAVDAQVFRGDWPA